MMKLKKNRHNWNDLLDKHDETDEAVTLEEKLLIPAYTAPIVMPDDELNVMIRSLNCKQC